MYRTVAIAVVTVLVCSLTAWAGEAPKDLKPKVEKPRRLQEGALVGNSLDSFKLSVGEIGRLDALELEILNVLGKDKLLVLPVKMVVVPRRMRAGTYSARGYGQALQSSILNSREEKQYGEPLIIYGWSTKGIVDGQKLKPSGLVKVEGTERYTSTVGVAKTVFKLRWYTPEEAEKEIEKHREETKAANKRMNKQMAESERRLAEARARAEKERQAAIEKAEKAKWRTWTDSTGKFTMEAKFRGVIAGKVRLEKADGKTLSIPIKQLSKEDQEWIRDR